MDEWSREQLRLMFPKSYWDLTKQTKLYNIIQSWEKDIEESWDKYMEELRYKGKEDLEDAKIWACHYIWDIHEHSHSIYFYVVRIEHDHRMIQLFEKHSKSVEILGHGLTELYEVCRRRVFDACALQKKENRLEKGKKNLESEILFNILSEEISEESYDKLIEMIEKQGKLVANKETEKEKVDDGQCWVEDYIIKIQQESPSLDYLSRIDRDKHRLEFLYHDKQLLYQDRLNTFVDILFKRVNELHTLFFTAIRPKLINREIMKRVDCFFEMLRYHSSTIDINDDNVQAAIGDLIVTRNKISDDLDSDNDLFEGIEKAIDGDRRVTVKPIPKAHRTLLMNEKRRLIELDGHPNIIRFIRLKSDEDFYYMCLETHMCSLSQLVYNSEYQPQLWSNGLPSQLLKDLLRDIAFGLLRLHKGEIVHGDIRPQTILVIKPIDTRLTAKISNMGVSKKVKKTSKPQCSPEQGLSKSHDLSNFGRILFSCITQGTRLFEKEDYKQFANISKENIDFLLISDQPEAVDLTSHLWSTDPNLRLNAEEVINHPFFWDFERKKKFVHGTSRRMSGVGNSALLQELQKVWGYKSWNRKIDQKFLQQRIDYKKKHNYTPYDFHSIRGLLELIRNCLEHYHQFSASCRTLLKSCPEGVLNYFSIHFPGLFIDVYNVISKYYKDF